ncbi:porphobilinogen deaminase [Devosia pacifica]|uniref:Hydroxymethylbilane synthase n=1 Tax=Devosia pacifica TaxID=1335967 RepID=A0A918VU31_9HYPH|nr:porphobilinogen deaminase [Devosia pacifica]
MFTKEIDQALFDNRIDIGVHSAKDMATKLPDEMKIAAFLEREDVRDAFISLVARGIDYLPEGGKFGTSSIRRAAQVKRMRPDLRIVPFRGNVQTRLQKLADGVADATLLAMAGLNRLGQGHRITLPLEPESFLPAPAQGAIALAVRSNDEKSLELASAINHAPTSHAVMSERALLDVLDGSCRTPVAALAQLDDGHLTIKAEILSLDGSEHFAESGEGTSDEAEAIGADVAHRLLAAAGPEFIARWSDQ